MRTLLRTTSVALVTVAGSIAIALPVHAEVVSVTTSGSGASVSVDGQPVVGVSDSNGQVCAGISLEVPVCAPGTSIGG
jgi:hypothetical protein